jgi:hypothetical protein
MLRWLMMIGSPILILTVVLVARYDKMHDTEGKGYDIKCTQSSDPSATVGTLICTAEHGQQTKSGEYNPVWWHIFFAWPEGITALLLLLTLAAITWQGWQTKKAADAALLNAEALVNSERPWLIAEVVRDSKNFHFYEIRINNFGRTPARFIRGDATSVFTENPATLPIPPTYSSPIFLPKNLVIAPDKGFPVPHGYHVPKLLQLAGGPDKTLVIYGRIIYEDTIIAGVEHEVAWCFGYVQRPRNGLLQGEFVLIGPSEYTKNT